MTNKLSRARDEASSPADLLLGFFSTIIVVIIIAALSITLHRNNAAPRRAIHFSGDDDLSALKGRDYNAALIG